MHRLITTAVLMIIPATLFAQEPRFENVITHAGYVQYMAELTCLTIKNRTQSDSKEDIFDVEQLKRKREEARLIAEKVDPKYGLDKLPSSEKNRMVSYFKSQRNTNQRVMDRIREISPSCDPALPVHLAEIMSRDQFIAYMAELFCLREKQPTLSVLPVNEKFTALSDTEQNMIVNAYTVSPVINGDIRTRVQQLNGQCK